MTSTDESRITLEIDGAAALVLLELLARFDKSDQLSIEDSAETCALWLLQGALERRIVEAFSPDYAERLGEARARLRSRYGGAEA